jgi:hypothetical protein
MMKNIIVSTIKKMFSKKSNNHAVDISSMDKEISAELIKLKKLSKAELVRKNEDVKEMISYYNGLTNSVEERRNKIYDFALQYLAVLLTVSGVLYSYKDKIEGWIFLIFITLIVVQLLAAFWTIVTYEFQSKYRYPFLKLEKYANKWKWFYYGNPYILKIDRNVFVKTNDDEKTKKPYLEGLKNFIINYSKEKLWDEISDNIQQLYLLQVHNYYKNKFYLNLVRIRLRSLQVSILILVIELIYLFLYPLLKAVIG